MRRVHASRVAEARGRAGILANHARIRAAIATMRSNSGEQSRAPDSAFVALDRLAQRLRRAVEAAIARLRHLQTVCRAIPVKHPNSIQTDARVQQDGSRANWAGQRRCQPSDRAIAERGNKRVVSKQNDCAATELTCQLCRRPQRSCSRPGSRSPWGTATASRGPCSGRWCQPGTRSAMTNHQAPGRNNPETNSV